MNKNKKDLLKEEEEEEKNYLCSDIRFPPVVWARGWHGDLCICSDFRISTFLNAYRRGIFPWPKIEEFYGPLEHNSWNCPKQRGVLFFENFKVAKSLQRLIKKRKFTVKLNSDFNQVIDLCAFTREDTWLTPKLRRAYKRLFKKGYAYSVEVYDKDFLVGGLYGVTINRYVSGESMFYLVPNASKIALVYLVNYLKEKGVKWIDCQVKSRHLSSFGTKGIPRDDFLLLLEEALEQETCLFPPTPLTLETALEETSSP
ncbi:MAG: leucyl/phenylalanyl-tRNA--protein transferase [Candidatus Dadabacteria bacterium]|nr:MAG: leucyl/phenylalanyl-tRNA--protein transferase [Candidatus Dadabacteria bacterium]